MAVPSYGDKLIPFCKSQGFTKVLRLRKVENHFHSLDWDGVDRWLSVEQEHRRDRRENITLSVAIVAAIIAVIAARADIKWFISLVISWFSN